jgi:hypothetical protein
LYRDQHQQAAQEPEPTSPAAFIPLTLSTSPATTAIVELHLCCGHRLVFHQMVSADYLKTLIR